jgi:hypothetical protein
MDSYGFLWISMDFYGFSLLEIYRNLGFLWIPMELIDFRRLYYLFIGFSKWPWMACPCSCEF